MFFHEKTIKLLYPDACVTCFLVAWFVYLFSSLDLSDSTIQLICVAKVTGLGLVIKGGANRADGPMVFIQELMPGGDCQKVILLPGNTNYWIVPIFSYDTNKRFPKKTV